MKFSKKTALIAAIMILVAGGTAYGFLYHQNNPVEEQTQTEGQDQDSEDPGRIQRDQVTDSEGPDSSSGQSSYGQGDEKKIKPDESGDSGGSLEAPEITTANQPEPGEPVRVSAIFEQSSTGNCELILSKSGYSNVTRTADIVVGPSYYACDGFRVQASEFPAKGEWQVRVVHHRNGNTATSETKTVIVE